jgi:hypothetical protein
VTELANDDIELAVWEWQVLRIPFDPVDCSKIGYAPILARYLQQRWGQIKSGNGCAGPRSRDCDDTGTRGDVEHYLAGPDLCEFDQVCRDRRGECRKWPERGPHFTLARL